MNNRRFSTENKVFIEACRKMGTLPTKRQASKFRNKKGLAWSERETQYDNCKLLIFKLAGTYARITRIECNELISAGNEKFLICQKIYKSNKKGKQIRMDKIKFSTYLTWQLKGLFLEMGRKKRLQATIIIPITAEYDRMPCNKANQEDLMFFVDLLKELSTDATEVCKIVFETPSDLIDMLPKKQPRGLNRYQIQNHLRRYGWTFPRIWKAFREITKGLKLKNLA